MPQHPLGSPTAKARADFKKLERKIAERVDAARRTGVRTLILVEIEAGKGGEAEPRIFSSVPYAPAEGPAA